MIQQLHISYEQKLLTSTDSIDPFLLENIIKKEIQNTQHATGKSLSFSSSCLSFVSIFVCVCSFLVILLWKRKKKIFLSFFLFFYVFSFLWPILSISGHSEWFQRRLLRGYGCLQCGRQQRKNRSFRVCRCKTCFSAGATRRKCRARHVNIFVFFFFFVLNVPDRASMCGC